MFFPVILLQNQIHAQRGSYVSYIEIDPLGNEAKFLGYSFVPGNSTTKHQKQELEYCEEVVRNEHLFTVHDCDPNTVRNKDKLIKKFF